MKGQPFPRKISPRGRIHLPELVQTGIVKNNRELYVNSHYLFEFPDECPFLCVVSPYNLARYGWNNPFLLHNILQTRLLQGDNLLLSEKSREFAGLRDRAIIFLENAFLGAHLEIFSPKSYVTLSEKIPELAKDEAFRKEVEKYL